MALFSQIVTNLYNGQSQPSKQIQDTLHLSENEMKTIAEGFKIVYGKFKANGMEITNQMFVNEKQTAIKPKFISNVKSKYNFEIIPINLSKEDKAIEIINKHLDVSKNWLREQIFAENNADCLILVNTIRFDHYHWKIPFDAVHTKSGNFFIDDQTTVTASFMHTKGIFSYIQVPEWNAQLVRMDYAQLDLFCLAILPNEGSSLFDLQTKLKEFDIEKMLSKMERKLVSLSFPKFTGEFGAFELSNILKKVGFSFFF